MMLYRLPEFQDRATQEKFTNVTIQFCRDSKNNNSINSILYKNLTEKGW